ncbi:MAG: class I SAM-dependent methyltransferase [Anaerolineales bacterium]|nr:MAG: class I SAM-dependent methyltransferase [Anaerolineales bacterium]
MFHVIDYDQIALEYARHRQVHPGALRSLLSTSRVDRASKVLEVGCGTGNYIVTLEALVGCSCWGIDPSGQMLSRARERSRTIHFQLGQAERLDFPQDFFDLVFSVDVIHHVGDRLAYLQEAHRVLRAGGKGCTVTDSDWIIRHRQPLTVYFPETVEIELGRYPRIAELRDIMGQVGFDEITEDTVEFAYPLTDVQAYRDKAFSALLLIPEDAYRRGIERMERDLHAGPIQCVSRYLLLWGTK